jgi:SAM-dependent methyltransferase
MQRKQLKQTIVSLPVAGYGARLASNVVRLPKLHEQIVSLSQKTTESFAEIKAQQAAQAAAFQDFVENTSSLIASLQLSQDVIAQQFSLLETGKVAAVTTNDTPQAPREELFADDHVMDAFYTAFEDRFRGTEELISERLEEYVPLFTNSKVNFKKTPVLDIGSGRGELLSLLAKHDVPAVGLDINHDMVKRSKEKGLNAVQGDALSHLQTAGPQSYGAITGFHLVEHIPFNILMRIFKSCHSALAKDGFIIFETPNPENLIVGSTTFYMDPSHLHPLPPALLAFAIETCGFRNVEILRLHSDDEKRPEKLPKEVQKLLFENRDYAVIAYK